MSAEDITNHLHEMIDIARENEGHLHHGFDLSEPCQIEVFWVDRPLEGQVILITHDRDRADREILVHGPFEGSSFVTEVEEVVDSERWQQPIPPPRDTIPGRGPPTRADILSSTIARFVEKLQQSIFADHPATLLMGGRRLWDDTFSHIFVGNIADYSIEDLFGGPNESDSSDSQPVEQEENTKQETNEVISAGGGYIYDPVWVEKAPTHSFSDLVWNNKPMTYDKISVAEIHDFDLHIYRDGLLLVDSEDGEEVQDILNTLFATGILHQYRLWRAIQRREIYSSTLVDGERTHSHYEMSTPTGRGELVHPSDRPSDTDRSLLPLALLERYSEIVDVVYPIHNVRNRMILHLQAHSHLLDDEFEASFVLNWTVVEQLLDDLLTENIQQKHNVEWEDKGLEFAEIAGLITESEYDLLDDHRDTRNGIIHDMDSVGVLEAEKFDLLVSKLVTQNINHYLERQNVDPIEFRPTPVKFSNRKPETRREILEALI